MIVFRRRRRLCSIIMNNNNIQLQALILIFVLSKALGSPISKSAATVSCPASHPGWRSWKDQKCILYHSTDVDYETGEKNCQSIGAQLVTITSSEEEDFVISLLKEKSIPNKSNAFYFWIDSVNAGRGIGFSSNPLGTAKTSRCPPRSNNNITVSGTSAACPAKVVKTTGKKAFWCYFDCNKEFVNAICEIIIKKQEGDEDGIQDVRKTTTTTTTRKRDISTKATLGTALPLTSSTRHLLPLTPAGLSSSSAPSATPSATSSPPPSDLTDAGTPAPAIMALDCDVGWKLQDDKCYKGIQMDTNGNEARNLCQFRDSAHLSSITSSGLQQAVQALVSNAKEAFNRPLLIDGRYDRGSRTFRWSETNQLFRYTNWAPGQPDLAHECVAMETNRSSDSFAAWKTIDCSQDANPLCSKPGRQSDATTTTVTAIAATTTTTVNADRSNNAEQPSPQQTSSPASPPAVRGQACGSSSSGDGQQEVTFDPAMMSCNESVDNGKERATAGKDGRHDEKREKMVHHGDRQVMSEAENERRASAAAAGGGGEGAGSGAKGVVVSSLSETGIPDAASDKEDRSSSNNNRNLTAGGSLTLSILILVLAGILLIICFLVRIRDMRKRRVGGNETKVISLQRSQHDASIYFDKSPVTALSSAADAADDDPDPDISLYDKSAFTSKS